jgi:hypothetical protein
MNNAKFLLSKVLLILKYADPEQLAGPTRDQLLPRYERIIAKLVAGKSPTKDWRDTEYDLNALMRGTVDPQRRKLINDELTKKFGSAGIGTTDVALVKKVLKRGSIVGNTEGQRIRDILSDLPGGLMNNAEETKLSAMYSKWEQGK